MKKTNKGKKMSKEITLEIKEVNRQIGIIKNDLVNSIDILFYDIENIEDQAKVFRTIISQFSNYDLQAIKEYVKISTDKGGK
jgi:hypothetical protein